MLPYAVTIWMVAAAIGGGLVMLHALRLLQSFSHLERVAIAFVLGTGFIGWLVFFPGWLGSFNSLTFAVILAALTLGLLLMQTPAAKNDHTTPFIWIDWVLLFGIAAVLLMDFSEALSPAADGDTMAYHFESPRRFLAEGVLYPIPRALDGISQLLLQMTYGVAMGLGGKAAAPLWTMISGWGLGFLFYALAHRHMSRSLALVGTLCLLTTPAIIYSAGTGQVEVRLASFAAISAYAAAMSVQNSDKPHSGACLAILAGLAAGFFAGSKVTGLLFSFATFIALAGGENAIRRMFLFSVAVVIGGAQWYVFNWYETGDPLFPLLWKFIDLKPGFPWNENIAGSLQFAWNAERPNPKSLGWFLIYPFRTIINPLPTFESLRTGLGPVVLVLLPFALIATTQAKVFARTMLFRVLAIAVVFYGVWYWLGPSLRVRHLLPVYPLVLLCVFTSVAQFLPSRPKIAKIIYVGVAVVLAVQIAGQAVFSKKYVNYIASGASRSAFLETNISGYKVIAWLNHNLKSEDKVLTTQRDWLYLLNVPYFFAHPSGQDIISIYPGATDTTRFLNQLASQRITHVVISKTAYDPKAGDPLGTFLNELASYGCLHRVAEIPATAISSRTIPQLGRSKITFFIFTIHPSECRAG